MAIGKLMNSLIIKLRMRKIGKRENEERYVIWTQEKPQLLRLRNDAFAGQKLIVSFISFLINKIINILSKP